MFIFVKSSAELVDLLSIGTARDDKGVYVIDKTILDHLEMVSSEEAPPPGYTPLYVEMAFLITDPTGGVSFPVFATHDGLSVTIKRSVVQDDCVDGEDGEFSLVRTALGCYISFMDTLVREYGIEYSLSNYNYPVFVGSRVIQYINLQGTFIDPEVKSLLGSVGECIGLVTPSVSGDWKDQVTECDVPVIEAVLKKSDCMAPT